MKPKSGETAQALSSLNDIPTSVSEHGVVDQPDVRVLPGRADRRLAHRLLLGRGLPPQGGQVGPTQVPLQGSCA